MSTQKGTYSQILGFVSVCLPRYCRSLKDRMCKSLLTPRHIRSSTVQDCRMRRCRQSRLTLLNIEWTNYCTITCNIARLICWCSAPSPSRAVRCRLCLIFAEKTRHGKKWPDNHHFPVRRLARTQEEHLRLVRNASAAGVLQRIWAKLWVYVCMWF